MVKPRRLPFALLLLLPSHVRAYPSSLSFTNDAALAYILADIPLFSVGLVGFAVFTFFFVMRRLNKVTVYIHLSVLFAFAAALFDLAQVFKRGYYNTLMDLDVTSVQILMVLRELSHSISFGLRFLFFWAFVQEPPRGELPFVSMTDTRRPNFISLDSDEIIHSGNWARFRLAGLLFKFVLLALVIAVVVLQTLWRLVTDLERFGPVYFTDAGIQIGLSSVFILKILYNSSVTPLTPRWKVFRDYSPVIFALMISGGIEIGMIVCFKFSETTLGRFFQAIELYTLLLFVLVSAFYKMPVRSSVVAELVRRRITALGARDEEDGNENRNRNRESQFSMIQAPYQLPPMDSLRSQEANNRNSTRPSLSQRISNGFGAMNAKLANSRIGSFQNIGQTVRSAEEGDQRRLWDQSEIERGPNSAGQQSYRISLEQTSPAQTTPGYGQEQETAGWRDPVMTNVLRNERSPQTLRSLAAPNAPSPVGPKLETIVVSDDASIYSAAGRDTLTAPASRAFAFETTESPIYGLDGIIRNLQRGGLGQSPEPYKDTSARSSGIENLLRQQQELDKSIEGLKRFSTSSAIRQDERMLSESFQSEFSLSKFPEPPFLVESTPTSSPLSADIPGVAGVKDDETVMIDMEDETSTMRAKSTAVSAISDNSMVVEDVPFEFVPPRMPAALAEAIGRGQNQSIPSISRQSFDSVFDDTGAGPSRTARLDSQGTQYDVTSFIGRLTAPAASRLSPLANISERDRATDSDAESVVPATISELTRVQVVESRRKSTDSIADSGIGHDYGPASSRSIPLIVPPLPSDPVVNIPLREESSPQAPRQAPRPQSPPQSSNIRPLLLQTGRGRGMGLPNGPRAGRLEISKPIRRDSDSDAIGGRNAFQRPRPAPLKLQGANDPRSVAPEGPRDGFYF